MNRVVGFGVGSCSAARKPAPSHEKPTPDEKRAARVRELAHWFKGAKTGSRKKKEPK